MLGAGLELPICLRKTTVGKKYPNDELEIIISRDKSLCITINSSLRGSDLLVLTAKMKYVAIDGSTIEIGHTIQDTSEQILISFKINDSVLDDYTCQWGDGSADYPDEDSLYFTSITPHGVIKIWFYCKTNETKAIERQTEGENTRRRQTEQPREANYDDFYDKFCYDGRSRRS